MGKIAICILCIFLSACSVTSKGTFCDIARPIRLSDQAIDAMSDREVQDALAHNLKGQRLCGWRP